MKNKRKKVQSKQKNLEEKRRKIYRQILKIRQRAKLLTANFRFKRRYRKFQQTIKRQLKKFQYKLKDSKKNY